jgi:hypothetical protein
MSVPIDMQATWWRSTIESKVSTGVCYAPFFYFSFLAGDPLVFVDQWGYRSESEI